MESIAQYNTVSLDSHFFDVIPIPLWLLNIEGTSVRLNRAMRAFLCTEEDCIEFKKFLNFTYTEDQEMLRAELEAVVTNLKESALVHRMYSVGCSQRWVSVQLSNLTEDHLAVQGVMGAVTDITESWNTREMLDASEMRMRALLEAIPYGIIMVEPLTGHVLRANPTAMRMIGATFEIINGIGIEDYLDITQLGKCEADRQFLKGANGKMLPVLRTSRIVQIDDKQVVLETFVDITAVIENERKLELLNKQLVETARQAGMSEVASSVLHNVGNVLNSVNVSAMMAEKRLVQQKIESLAKLSQLFTENSNNLPAFFSEEKGKKIPEFLSSLTIHFKEERDWLLKEMKQLNSNVEHIKHIVSLQQTYARSASAVGEYSINDVIDSSIDINKAGIVEHGIQLEKQIGHLPQIYGDQHRVLQILVNLLSNARYAVLQAEQSAAKRIAIRVREEVGESVNSEPRFCIEIEDNGIGISNENIKKIFAHGFTTKKSGHGFGLHSSVLAAREMGGDLVVSSAGVGKGAKFKLILPLRLKAMAEKPA